MSKVKQAIETALENISNATSNTYGAKLYTFDQVAMILQYLLDVVNEDDTNTNGFVTAEQLEDLAQMISERIDGNINDMTDSDIVDEDSIEMSISGGRATVEDISIDKDNIIDNAQCNIDDTIASWAAKHGIGDNS
jgi:hypothetical protein